jgi:hypothetical protein
VSSGIKAQKYLFAFYNRGNKDSPYHQEEEIGKHSIHQRRGKCRGEGVGKCLIQPWKERCMTYVPDSRTWRKHRGAQPMLDMSVNLKVKMKLDMKEKKLQ